MVPVYIRPSLVWMRQYSPSRVGRMGPPILVVISMPSAVMERTMRPRVSMWAHRPTRFALFPAGHRHHQVSLVGAADGVAVVPGNLLRDSRTTWSVKPLGLSMDKSRWAMFMSCPRHPFVSSICIVSSFVV